MNQMDRRTASVGFNKKTNFLFQAIEEFFRLLSLTSKSSTVHGALKLAPLWLVRLVLLLASDWSDLVT